MDMDDELDMDLGEGFDPDENTYYFDASDGATSRALAIYIKTPQGKDLTMFVSVLGIMVDYSGNLSEGSAFFRYEDISSLMYEFFGDSK